MKLGIKPNIREAIRKMMVAHANCVCADIKTDDDLNKMAQVINNSMYELSVITGTSLAIGIKKGDTESFILVTDTITNSEVYSEVTVSQLASVEAVKDIVLDVFNCFSSELLDKLKAEEESEQC